MKSWFMAGSEPQDYELGIDTKVAYHGKNSGYLKAKVVEPKGFGTMMQMFKANDYLNKRMRFSAVVKSGGIESWAGLWMRIDGPTQRPLGFDNMQNRPISKRLGMTCQLRRLRGTENSQISRETWILRKTKCEEA